MIWLVLWVVEHLWGVWIFFCMFFSFMVPYFLFLYFFSCVFLCFCLLVVFLFLGLCFSCVLCFLAFIGGVFVVKAEVLFIVNVLCWLRDVMFSCILELA